MPTPVTAVIVTYNSAQCIDAALGALADAHRQQWLRCIVVDNASTDDTARRVATAHPWVRLIVNSDNLGYGSAANIGWRAADSPYILLLNPDVIMSPDAAARLADTLDKDSRVAMAGPALQRPDGSYQHIGARLTPWRLIRSAAGLGDSARRPILPQAPATNTDWLCGAALMIRRGALQQVGGFDSRFFLYFEETDLCWRLVQNGWQLRAVGEAIATHHGGSSASACDRPMHEGCLAEHFFSSRYYYLAKHYGRIAATFAECLACALLSARAGVAVLRGRSTAHAWDRLRYPTLHFPSRAFDP